MSAADWALAAAALLVIGAALRGIRTRRRMQRANAELIARMHRHHNAA